MGKCYLHGNDGISMNFRIIGGTSAPSNPRENDIWVNTETEITAWTFRTTEPDSPTEGLVWFRTGSESAIEFNALKKNMLQVYPRAIKQYNNGAWEDITAQSYQGGAWVDWWDGCLINGNEVYENIVGEWVEVKGTVGIIEWSNDGVLLSYDGAESRHASIYSKNAIELTGFNTLRATITNAISGSTKNMLIGVRTSPTTSVVISEYAAGYTSYSEVPKLEDAEQIVDVDISTLSGSYYVQVGAGVATLQIKKLQLI